MKEEMQLGDLIEKRTDPSSVQYVHCQIPLNLHTARALDFRIGAKGKEEILVQKVYVSYEWELKEKWKTKDPEQK